MRRHLNFRQYSDILSRLFDEKAVMDVVVFVVCDLFDDTRKIVEKSEKQVKLIKNKNKFKIKKN